MHDVKENDEKAVPRKRFTRATGAYLIAHETDTSRSTMQNLKNRLHKLISTL
jgi:hypothetical protein